jgi:hypothetical protein
MAEFVGPNDCSDTKLSLTNKRFWIDDEPGLALRSQHIVPVKILMDENLPPLGFSESIESLKRSTE